jgi:protein subunit release factor A
LYINNLSGIRLLFIKKLKKNNKMKNSIIIEIRASEGGNDSKLLVNDLMDIYLKSARNNNFSSKILEELNGFASV